MLHIGIRVMLILGSAITLLFMLRRIRRSRVQIKDSISWIIFALALLVLSIFPQIAIWSAFYMGIESPINFVYLLIIFLLLVQAFSSSLRVSQMDARLRQLAQKLAIHEKNEEEKGAPAQESAASSKGNIE